MRKSLIFLLALASFTIFGPRDINSCIKIPGESPYHVVQKGDSLWTISNKYQIPFGNILELNPPENFKSGDQNTIYVNERVRIVNYSD